MSLTRCVLQNVHTLADFYRQLHAQLPLPPHFGDNQDALWDALTGDLPGPSFDGAFGDVVTGSWRAIRAAGARTVYPGHGPPRPMPPADG